MARHIPRATHILHEAHRPGSAASTASKGLHAATEPLLCISVTEDVATCGVRHRETHRLISCRASPRWFCQVLATKMNGFQLPALNC